jgi:hypothetical protein
MVRENGSVRAGTVVGALSVCLKLSVPVSIGYGTVLAANAGLQVRAGRDVK